MLRGYIKMQVDKNRFDEIMDRLTKAQEEIQNCYRELEELGMVEFIGENDEKTAE